MSLLRLITSALNPPSPPKLRLPHLKVLLRCFGLDVRETAGFEIKNTPSRTMREGVCRHDTTGSGRQRAGAGAPPLPGEATPTP